ncbi:MAG: TRAP transporter substrate-binding protein [Synergistaceae bacterium]|jgi:tripartite ATP-independent transporter DctP family solute receptor|nr:TRAP transporter substrate-binding protein [Synergistaceae bacterium]
MRKFCLALCLTGILAGVFCGAAMAEPKLFKVTMTLPEGHPAHDMGNLFGKLLMEKTNGALTAKSFGSDQLGNTIASIEGIQMGTIEAGFLPSGPISQFLDSWEVFSLPYIFKDEKHMFRALEGEFGNTMIRQLNDIDMVFLSWANSGSRNVITNKRAVNTPADLNGLKIRVMDSKLMVDTLNAMGAIATPMAQAEVYSALQQGVIDGWENNPTTLYALKLYEVSDYYSWTQHFITPDLMVISKPVFDSLTPDQQKAVMEAGAEAGVAYRTKIWPNYLASVIKELEKHNVKFNEVTDFEGFVKATQSVRDAYIAKHGDSYLKMIEAAK